MKHCYALLAIFIFLCRSAFTQHVEINSQNKTIAVSADATVTADPEIAVLHLGYENFGKTKEEAFQNNVVVSNQILGRLTEAGIKKEQIESSDMQLGRVDMSSLWTDLERRKRQFRAHQTWKIKVPVSQAESTLQLAVKVGANETSDPEWDVVNSSELQAKAGASALAKAKKIAEEMAAGLNTKLGRLIYASNKAPALIDFLEESSWGGLNLGGARAYPSIAVEPLPGLRLKLFPQKVKQDATVFAVFSIE